MTGSSTTWAWIMTISRKAPPPCESCVDRLTVDERRETELRLGTGVTSNGVEEAERALHTLSPGAIQDCRHRAAHPSLSDARRTAWANSTKIRALNGVMGNHCATPVCPTARGGLGESED